MSEPAKHAKPKRRATQVTAVDARSSTPARVMQGPDAPGEPGSVELEQDQIPLDVLPLTPERWPDLEALFGAKGCSEARGCWCMFYRVAKGLPRLEGESTPQASRRALKALTDAGTPPGLIGYRGGVPVGWVSLGPRQDFERLKRSTIRKAIDDRPVRSIVCFVVPSAYRREGVAAGMLDGAIRYARSQGVATLEAYPIDLDETPGSGGLWFGVATTFARAGFEEVARRRQGRPIMRLRLV